MVDVFFNENAYLWHALIFGALCNPTLHAGLWRIAPSGSLRVWTDKIFAQTASITAKLFRMTSLPFVKKSKRYRGFCDYEYDKINGG